MRSITCNIFAITIVLVLSVVPSQSFNLEEFTYKLQNGGPLTDAEVIEFLGYLSQEGCMEENSPLGPESLACGMAGTKVAQSGKCPVECRDFYRDLGSRCPDLFRLFILPGSTSLTLEDVLALCEIQLIDPGDTNISPTPDTGIGIPDDNYNGDSTDTPNDEYSNDGEEESLSDMELPESCDYYFTTNEPPMECTDALEDPANANSNTCPDVCVSYWSSFPEDCKSDMREVYQNREGAVEYTIQQNPPIFVACLAIAYPEFFGNAGAKPPEVSTPPVVPTTGNGETGNTPTGTDTATIPPGNNENGNQTGENTETTDAGNGEINNGNTNTNNNGNGETNTNETGTPVSGGDTTVVVPPSGSANQTDTKPLNNTNTAVTASEVPSCVSASSSPTFMQNLQDCLTQLDQQGITSCPKPCKQSLNSMSAQCKKEINAIALKQDVPVDVEALAVICNLLSGVEEVQKFWGVAVGAAVGTLTCLLF